MDVGEVLTLLSAFRQVFLASLRSSLNQIVLCLTTLCLLFGILWLAIFMRMFAKFPYIVYRHTMWLFLVHVLPTYLIYYYSYDLLWLYME